MAKMPDVFGDLSREWAHLRHHETTAAPATATATPTEEPMPLAKLEDDVKTDLTQGLDWLEGFVGRVKAAAPGIIATAEQYEQSPIVQALEGAFLPAAVEQSIANTINELKKAFPAPAAPETPAEPPAA